MSELKCVQCVSSQWFVLRQPDTDKFAMKMVCPVTIANGLDEVYHEPLPGDSVRPVHVEFVKQFVLSDLRCGGVGLSNEDLIIINDMILSYFMRHQGLGLRYEGLLSYARGVADTLAHFNRAMEQVTAHCPNSCECRR